MTFREIYIAAQAISKRRSEEMKFQARCLGAELSDDDSKDDEVDGLSELDLDKIEEISAKILEGKGYGRRNN